MRGGLRSLSVLLVVVLLATSLSSTAGAQSADAPGRSGDTPAAERRANVPQPATEPAGRPDGWEPPGKAVAAEAVGDLDAGAQTDEEVLEERQAPGSPWSNVGRGRGASRTIDLDGNVVIELPESARPSSITVGGRSAPEAVAARLSEFGVAFSLDVGGTGIDAANDDVLLDGEEGWYIEPTTPDVIEPAIRVEDEPEWVRNEDGDIIGVAAVDEDKGDTDAPGNGNGNARGFVELTDFESVAEAAFLVEDSGYALRVPLNDVDVPGGMALDGLVMRLWTGCDADGECTVVRELPTSVDWEANELVVPLSNRVLSLTASTPSTGDGVEFGAASNDASYYGIGATTSSQFGDYSALPGSLSTYQVGVQTGHAEAGYSFPVPPAVGPSPSVGLSYSSGSVDAFTGSTNTQGGLVGLGWSLGGSQITRDLRTCADNDDGGTIDGNKCLSTGALDDGFSISLNGVSSRLAKIDGASGFQNGQAFQEYRLESDPSWRVRLITDAAPMPDAVAIAAQSGSGYWLVNPAGEVHSFGSATQLGNANSSNDIVDIAATPSGNGYWLVSSIGEVYAFGDATYYGGTQALSLNAPITQIEPTPTGNGYWLLAEDGGLFTFGAAGFSGNVSTTVKAMTAVSSSAYLIMQQGGIVHAFGGATDHGDWPGYHVGITDIVGNAAGTGYWLVNRDGWSVGFGGATGNPHAYGVVSDFVVDVELDPNGGAWHLQEGGIVRNVGGADWTPASLGHTTRDRWEVTTPDGTVYTFGAGRTPTLGRATNSVDTVPVYVAGSGCRHDLCDTAYAWHLDKVEDTVGNAQYRFYTQEANWFHSRITATATTPRKYVRASRPFGIEYGNAPGTSNLPSAMAYFTYTSRPTSTTPDLLCSTFAVVCSQTDASFFTSQRLATVETRVRNSAGTNWDKVMQWVLDASAYESGVNPGTIGNPEYLRLTKVTQQDPNSSGALPPVNYTYVDKANRADGQPSGGVSDLYTSRLSRIENELGGWVDFVYGQDRPYLSSAACNPSQTTWQRRECDIFPAWVRFEDPNNPGTFQQGWAVFNKWKVMSQTVTARWGSTPATTTFNYVSNPRWAYTQGFGNHSGTGATAPGFGPNTWSEYRGHNHVEVSHPDGTITRHFFYTGMHGNPVSSGSSDSFVNYNGVNHIDHAQLSGRPLAVEQLGSSSSHPRLGATEYVYEIDQLTAGERTANGWPTAGGAQWPDFRQINTVQVTSTRYDNAGVQVAQTRSNTTFDDLGNVLTATDHGDLSATGDETHTFNEYAPNTTDWIVAAPFRTRTWASTAVNVGTIVGWQEFKYDQPFGSTSWSSFPAPTQGLLTHARSALNIDSSWRWPETRTEHNNRGQVIKVRNPEGQVTEAGYDASYGYQTYVDGPLGGTSDRTTFNIVDPAFGVIERVTAPNSQETNATYDWAGRLLTVQNPGSPAANTQYGYYLGQSAPSLVVTTSLLDPGEYLSVHTFVDGFGRQIQTQSPSSAGSSFMTVTSNSFDDAGRAHRSSAPYDVGLAGGQTPGSQGYIGPNWASLVSYSEIDYNPGGVEGKVTTHQMSQGSIETSSSVLVNGLTTTATDPKGHTSSSIVDALGRTVSTTDVGGAVTQFAYDTARQLTRVTDDANNVTDVTYYYPGGLKKDINDPDSGTTAYTYDLMGRLLTQTDANQSSLWFDYDELGRQTELRAGSASATLLARWNYDPASNRIGLLGSSESFVGENVTVTNTYDSRLRLTGRTWDIAGAPADYTFNWTYREAGSVDTMTYPDPGTGTREVLTHSYDVLEQPVGLVSSIHGDLVRDATYTPFGATESLLIGSGANAIDIAYDYNDRESGEDGTLRLAGLTATVAGSSDLNYGYQWDDNSNLTRISDSGEGVTGTQYQCFTYTNRNELDLAYTTSLSDCSSGNSTGPNPFSNNWNYDDIGNITLAHGTGTLHGSYVYGQNGAGPHAVTTVNGSAGTTTYGYDAVGNMTSRNVAGETPQTLAYDGQNRLSSVTESGQTAAEFVYDADGVRVVRTIGDITTYVINELFEVDVDNSQQASSVGGPAQLFDPFDSQANGPAPSQSGGQALLVAGSTGPAPGDVPVRDQLIALGYTVTIKTAAAVTAADAAGKDVVVVTSSFAPNDLGNKLESIAVPMMMFEPWAYDDHEFSTWCGGGCAETSTSQSQLVIADPSHPMAAGLTGTVTVSTGASNFSWGVPSSAGDVIATVVGDPGKSPIFAYESGDAMDGGFVAPARRVGFFFSYATSQHTTSNGWALFDAAINWLTGSGGSNQPPSVDAGPDQSIQQPGPASLDATVTDDGLPSGSSLTYLWTQVSGPGTASFASPNTEDTDVTFSADGTYVLQLIADDGASPASDNVSVTVTTQGSQGNGRVTTDLLALYEFTETSGSTVADTSGVSPAMNLTIGNVGVTNWTGDALEVNGDTLISSGGAASKINTAVAASGQITVEAWIAPSNVTQNGPARIVTVSASPFARNVTLGQGVYASSGDRLEARLRATGTGTNGTPATQTAVGTLDTQLQHVVFTRDAAGVTTVWIDGVVVATGTASGNLSNWDATMGFGLAAELDNSRFWHGDFHLVAVYDRALSGAEVGQNFTAGADPGSTPPPASSVSTTSYYMFSGAMVGFAADGVLSTAAAGHLGSTELTNTGGNIERQTYLPFGGVRSSAANALGTDHTYTGQVDDGLGWMHYRARQYDPLLGRFMQADTIVVDGLNRYTYVRNNPIVGRDPSGRCTEVFDHCVSEDGSVSDLNTGRYRSWLAHSGLEPNLVSLYIERLQNGDRAIIEGIATNESSSNHARAEAQMAIRLFDNALDGGLIVPDESHQNSDSPTGYGWKWFHGCESACSSPPNNKLLSIYLTGVASSAWDEALIGAAGDMIGNWSPGPSLRCGPGNSFAAGSEVLLADGSSRPIDEIEPGDTVLSYEPETGRSGGRTVEATIVGSGEKTLVDVELNDDIIVATDLHPFWVVNDETWTDAIDLEPGDQLLLSDGTTSDVTAITVRAETTTVYNLTVADIHTYFVEAGGDYVLVHNTNRGCVYLRVDNNTGEEYVGQTIDLPRRTRDHTRKNPDADYDFYELETDLQQGVDLDIAEENWIRVGGGPQSTGGRLSNKRHQVNDRVYRENGGLFQ